MDALTDNHSKEVRSYNMTKIKSCNTKPEEIVRKYLFSKGLRYTKNDKRYPGHPDLVLPKYKVIIFINGCFWHMHENCSRAVIPKSNIEYWHPKLLRNKKRDIENRIKLVTEGWKVITIWECELRKDNRNSTLEKTYNEIVMKNRK